MILVDKPSPEGKWCNECSGKTDVLSISVEGDGKRSSIPLCKMCRDRLVTLLVPDITTLRARVEELEERNEQWAKKWDAAVETGGNNTQRALEEVARLKSIIDEALERTKERDAALEEVARLWGQWEAFDELGARRVREEDDSEFNRDFLAGKAQARMLRPDGTEVK